MAVLLKNGVLDDLLTSCRGGNEVCAKIMMSRGGDGGRWYFVTYFQF